MKTKKLPFCIQLQADMPRQRAMSGRKPRILTPKKSKLGKFFQHKEQIDPNQQCQNQKPQPLTDVQNLPTPYDHQMPSLLKVKSLTMFGQAPVGRIHDRHQQIKHIEIPQASTEQTIHKLNEYGFPVLDRLPGCKSPRTPATIKTKKQRMKIQSADERRRQTASLHRLQFTFG